MFGTMGISELIIILAIVLIIFGAGKLPQIGEGVGKALKGFKKEVHDIPPPDAGQSEMSVAQPQPVQTSAPTGPPSAAPAAANPTPQPTAPYTPGPELTPGTTASLMYQAGPQGPQAVAPRTAPQGQAPAPAAQSTPQPVSMEERAAHPGPVVRAQYPPLPPSAQPKPAAKRPSAIVNKEAVARVQAQQAALKAQAQQPAAVSPNDMQHLGEGLGDALRTFRQAVADVRNTVDPEMKTIQAEMDAAQKELQQSIEAAKELPPTQDDSTKQA